MKSLLCTRVITGYLLGLFVLVGFSGCEEATDPDKTIIMWDQMDPSESALLLQHLEQYKKMHPEIKILRSQYDNELLRTQFQTAASAGSGPDLVYGPSDLVGPFSVLRIIRALDEIIPADTLAHFFPAAFDTLNEHVWALPDQLGNHLMLLYNRALLQDPPQNLDEFARVAGGLTRDTTGNGRSDQYGLVFDTSEPFWLIPFLGAFDGWVFDSSNEPTLNTPAMVGALEYMQEIKNTLRVIPKECDRQLADTMFKEGKAAMIINGPWSIQAYREAGIDVGIARIPRHAKTGSWATPMLGSKGYLVNANVSNEKLPRVLDLLYFLTSAAVGREYAKLSILPARDEVLNEIDRGDNEYLNASRQQYEVGRRMPVVPEMRAVWDALRPSLQLVMNGSLDPERAAERMQRDAVKKIASMKR